MKNIKFFLLDLFSLSHQQWYLQWIFLPILAYYGSLMTGVMVLILFPISLIGAQYVAIRTHPASERAAYWWWWLLAVTLFAIPALRLLGFILETVGINAEASTFQRVAGNIFAFYVAQLLGEFLLPHIFITWRMGWWSVGNLVAALVWIGIYAMLYALQGANSSGDRFWYYGGYPLISLFANGVTGYFLHLAIREE